MASILWQHLMDRAPMMHHVWTQSLLERFALTPISFTGVRML